MKKKIIIDFVSLLVSLALMIAAHFVTNKEVSIFFWSAAFIIGGRSKAIEGVQKTIQDRSLNVEFLMIISALSAFFIGNYQEGSILIFIFALSGVLEEYALNKSGKELASLMKLVPNQAIKMIDNQEKIVHIDELLLGDVVIVKVGQQVPADGLIIQGTTTFDESMITGEYIPLYKTVGDSLKSGTINLESAIYMKVTASAKDSSMQKIVNFIKKAQNEQTKTEVGIEKFEKYYVYVVLFLAAMTIFIPPLFKIWDFDTSLYKGIVFLVVASPCALVSSVTPVMLSAMSRGSKEGVLIKGATAIQKLSNVQTICLDKTGTLTEGKPNVIDIDLQVENKQQVFDYLYHIEKQSNHPLAKSVVIYLEDKVNDKNLDVQTKEIKGKGIEADINGDIYFIGKTDKDNELIKKKQISGYTTATVTKNHEVIGVISFSDHIRENVVKTIDDFKTMNIKTMMLTGDNLYNANSISKQVGINYVKANCMPEDKVNIIIQEKKRGLVAMVGDGINDGPSLAVADIGIAMGSGSDVALETSDVVLMHSNIDKISSALKIAKKAKMIYMQNIIFSVTVIIFLVCMNVFGFIKLPMGVVFHEGSTILVILNGLRLLIKR